MTIIGLSLLLAFPMPLRAELIETDVCVYGATSGGIAAAIQAARMGKSVVIAEPGRFIGGLTTGGLGATDIGNKAAIGGSAGTADIAWQWSSTPLMRGSYALNGWLYEQDPYATGLQFKKESAIQKPAETPSFGDAMWVDGWPTATDWPSRDLYAGSTSSGPIGGMGRFAIARHGGRAPGVNAIATAGQRMPGAVTLAYTDGHAALVKLDDLWKQSWHRNYVPPATIPTPR